MILLNPQQDTNTAPRGGDPVSTSGIYRAHHGSNRAHDGEHALIVDQLFPLFVECTDVRYILVKAAPSAPERADFSPPAKKKTQALRAEFLQLRLILFRFPCSRRSSSFLGEFLHGLRKFRGYIDRNRERGVCISEGPTRAERVQLQNF